MAVTESGQHVARVFAGAFLPHFEALANATTTQAPGSGRPNLDRAAAIDRDAGAANHATFA